MNSKKALFFDRDGVINKRIVGGYVKSIAEFEFLPDVIESLSILRPVVDYFIIVTNQQGIGKKLMTENDLQAIHSYMQATLRQYGVWFDAIYYCPHLQEEQCICRKPATGLFHKALQEFPDINVEQSWMIGDTKTDVQFALNAGLQSVLLTAEKSIYQGEIHYFYNLSDFARYYLYTQNLHI